MPTLNFRHLELNIFFILLGLVLNNMQIAMNKLTHEYIVKKGLITYELFKWVTTPVLHLQR